MRVRPPARDAEPASHLQGKFVLKQAACLAHVCAFAAPSCVTVTTTTRAVNARHERIGLLGRGEWWPGRMNAKMCRARNDSVGVPFVLEREFHTGFKIKPAQFL